MDFRALDLDPGQIFIQDVSDAITNAFIVIEDVNGNSQVDDSEFAVAVRVDGEGVVTLQDMLL